MKKAVVLSALAGALAFAGTALSAPPIHETCVVTAGETCTVVANESANGYTAGGGDWSLTATLPSGEKREYGPDNPTDMNCNAFPAGTLLEAHAGVGSYVAAGNLGPASDAVGNLLLPPCGGVSSP